MAANDSNANRVKVASFAVTDVGGRTDNQDAFLLCDAGTGDPALTRPGQSMEIPSAGLFAMVVDGMGGAQGGETASQLIRDTIKNFLVARKSELSAGGMSDGRPMQEVILQNAILEADNQVRLEASRLNLTGMGACVTCVLVQENKFYLANVGDSRTYRISNNEIKQISLDNSFVADMVRAGQLTPEAARTHPRRNVLTQCVGAMPNKPAVQTNTFELNSAGDMLLLCSDGLHGVLTDSEILQLAIKSPSPRDACRALIDAAKAAKTADNATVAICGVMAAGAVIVDTPSPSPSSLAKTVITSRPSNPPQLPKKVNAPLGIGVVCILVGLIVGMLLWGRPHEPEFGAIAYVQNGTAAVRIVSGGWFGKQSVRTIKLSKAGELKDVPSSMKREAAFRGEVQARAYVMSMFTTQGDNYMKARSPQLALKSYQAAGGKKPDESSKKKIQEAALAVQALYEQDATYKQAQADLKQKHYDDAAEKLVSVTTKHEDFLRAEALLAKVYRVMADDVKSETCLNIVKSKEAEWGLTGYSARAK